MRVKAVLTVSLENFCYSRSLAILLLALVFSDDVTETFDRIIQLEYDST